MNPTDTALSDAQNTFDIAVRRHAELHAAAVQARRDADDAIDTAHLMLDQAAAGTGTIDAVEHKQADLHAVDLAHSADVAEAAATGALRRQEEAEVALLRAKAEQHVAHIRRLARLELEAAEALDTSRAQTNLSLGLLKIAAQALSAATQAAVEHDAHMVAVAASNATLAAMPTPEWPKTRMEYRYATCDIAIPVTWTCTNGYLHHLFGSVSDWRAASLRSILPDIGERHPAQMRAATGLMGRAIR